MGGLVMGIFIHMSISKSVTKREWENVYEETLQLAKLFPLAERQKVKCRGIETICLVPTVEREEAYGWHGEKIRQGWFADGDYETMRTAEEYALYRDMIDENEVEMDAGDALLGALPAYLNYDWEDSRCSHTYEIWGGKTQGEPYHMYLLSIACLIEARLGEKAFVYGDITRGQCKKAVELANEHLRKPIDVPDRCDMERFFKRVSQLNMSEKEQFAIFNALYLGTKDSIYGDYIRGRYSDEIFDNFWKNKFKNYQIGMIGFDDYINKYLLWGFDLGKLCSFVNYNDDDNVPQYEKFIKRIMDTKLHLKKKNCEDILQIDQEESAPYSIYTLMAQFVFASARNKKVERYIPISEVKAILIRELGDKCAVADIIDEYLKQESQEQKIKLSGEESDIEFEELCQQDSSEIFSQLMNTERQMMTEQREKYDITTYEELIYYEAGDSMEPNLRGALKKAFIFYNSLLDEKYYKELMEQTASIRCRWLVDHNRSILIREQDWNKIFTDIEEDKESFSRYYPMMRLKLNHEDQIYMIIAIALNDELYEYCKQFIKEEQNEEYS